MKFLKGKWMYLVGLLAVFIILYIRFGNGLFRGILTTFIVIAALFIIGFISTDEGKKFLAGLLGTIFLVVIAAWVLYLLFGKTLPFLLAGGAFLFLFPKIRNKYNEKREKIKQENEIARKKAEITEIAATGYLDDILNERIKAFNADLQALNLDPSASEREPKTLWLTLDQQLQYLKDNADRMNGLDLRTDDRNYLEIIRNCRDAVYWTLGDSSLQPFIKPLQELYGRYGFDYEKAYKKLNDAIYSYNGYYYEASRAFFKELYGKRRGVEGELRVSKELDLFKDVILNLTNIRFEVDGQSVESDSMVITEKGLFDIEIKNFGEGTNNTLIITKDGQWIIEYEDGGSEVKDDVMEQVNRHIGLKQRLINTKLRERLGDQNVPYIRIHPIIVIANNSIRIENESDLPIIRPSQIYHYIMEGKGGDFLDKKYWQPIREIIEKYNLPPKKFPIKDNFECLEQEYKLLWEQIKTYYVLTSMAKTYVSDIEEKGCSLPVSSKRRETPEFNSDVELRGECCFDPIEV